MAAARYFKGKMLQHIPLVQSSRDYFDGPE
jgi:hypothetical protein